MILPVLILDSVFRTSSTRNAIFHLALLCFVLMLNVFVAGNLSLIWLSNVLRFLIIRHDYGFAVNINIELLLCNSEGHNSQ